MFVNNLNQKKGLDMLFIIYLNNDLKRVNLQCSVRFFSVYRDLRVTVSVRNDLIKKRFLTFCKALLWFVTAVTKLRP
jgi:hypothetical protein